MVAPRYMAVWCALLALAAAVLSGCPQRGSKLVRREKEIRFALQDIGNVMSGRTSLAPGKDIAITRNSVEMWLVLNYEPSSAVDVKIATDITCRHVLDTLGSLDVEPAQDEVTVIVHALRSPPPDATGMTTAPELGATRYDWQTGETSFAEGAR